MANKGRSAPGMIARRPGSSRLTTRPLIANDNDAAAAADGDGVAQAI